MLPILLQRMPEHEEDTEKAQTPLGRLPHRRERSKTPSRKER